MRASRKQGRLIYEFGSFRLDAADRQLSLDGKRVALTRIDFDLLVVLVKNSGRLMEMDKLHSEVWPEEAAVEDATIARHIANLRKALGDRKGAPRYIKTEPSFGYRFIHEVKEVRRALAVLPFQPMTGRSEDDMMGLGLASAVITKLDSMNVKDLVVRPRSAVIPYHKPNQNPLAAAREQNADYVVAGSFQSAGKRMRVDVDFLRVHDEEKIWTREFTGEITDNLSLQQTLANSIARDVVLSFGQVTDVHDERRVKGDETASTEAYQLYVEGRFHWNKFTTDGFKKAIICFMGAIQKDPLYAKAYAAISDCWTWVALYSLLPPDRAFPKARKWAEKALKIYPDLSGAHTTMALIEMFLNRDYVTAAERFERAIQLYPNNVKAHLGYSLLLTGQKQFDAALKKIDKALEIYSASLVNNVIKGMILYQARRYGDALTQLAKTAKLDENSDAVYHIQALVYAQQGEYQLAVEAARTAIEKSAHNLLNHMVLAYVLAKTGAKTEARKLLKNLELSDRDKRYVSPFHLATVHLALGHEKQARHWLEQARDKHDPWFVWLHTEPRLDSLSIESID